MTRGRALGWLCAGLAALAAWAAPGQAQMQTQGEIQPLQVESDVNGVNLTSGQARRPVPVLQIPAAPNLRLERLNMLLPMLQATVTGIGAGDYSVNRGGLTSENFECETEPGCTAQQGSGSALFTNIRVCNTNQICGIATYTEGRSGRKVFFTVQLGASGGPGGGQAAYYASSITYPSGEVLTFSYETISGGGSSFQRPTQVASNLGYVMIFTWRSNNISSQDSQTLAEAAIYRADDTATPLARHIYGDGTPYPVSSVTDLAGRTWSCCTDFLSSPAESPAFSMRLPGMGNDSFAATSSSFGWGAHWVTQYVSDGAVYNYSYVSQHFPLVPVTLPVEATISGPEGYALTAEIAIDAEAGRPSGSMITRVTNALNQQTNFSYDEFHRLLRIDYPEGNAASVVYGEVGNITHRRVHAKPGTGLPTLEERAEYDTDHAPYNCLAAAPDVRCWRPVWTRDEAGNQTDYTWDAQGNMLTMLEPVDANGRRRKTINTWTASGGIYRLTRQRICSELANGTNVDCGTAAEQRTNTTYWQNTLLPLTVSRTNGVNSLTATTTYAYDDAGRVLSEDGPLAGTDDALYYRYDLSGRRTYEIGRAGANASRRATTRTTWRAADNQPTRVETGELASPTDPSLGISHRTDYSYDTRRLATHEWLVSSSVTYAVSQHSYDLRNRRICTATRMNPAQFGSLPASACDLDTTGSMGPDRIQRATLDALSRPTQIVGGYRVLNGAAGNVEIKMAYTPNGQVQWREDGEANRTNYTYDAYDRLRRSTFPDATYEELSYDSRSNVTQRRNRAARLILHAYDGAGRLTGTSYNSYGTGEGPVAYDYDGQGREVEVERTGGSTSLITIAYDALGRRASETQDGRAVAWQYDIASRPTRLTWPDNVYVTYDHSPAAQLTAIRDSGGAALISYGYDTFGRPTTLTRANGLVTAISYDPVARLSRLNHQGLVYTDLTYNPSSQIATRTLSSSAWAWDEGLNVDLDYDVNNLNQYTEVGTTDFAYDLTGNLTDDGPSTYAYDAENRMRWSVRSPSVTVHLRYDGRGRLLRRWGSGAGTTDYVYDGDAMIAEYNNATGAVLRRYIHGAGVDDPLIWQEGAGTSDRRFLHADERGSITTVTNNTGGIIARNIYDEWGNPGAANIGRFQYTGQQWLPEIGLYYYKARFYAPALGRFMQIDPIGYEDGMNFYAYVGNDPLSSSDPTGLLGSDCTTGSHTGRTAAECRHEIDYEQARGLADDRRNRAQQAASSNQNRSSHELQQVTSNWDEHDYARGPYLVCSDSDHCRDTMREVFPEHIVPHLNRRVVDGGIYPVYLFPDRIGPIVGHVQVLMSANGLSATNVTQPDHFLRQGQVDIQHRLISGNWYVQFRGYGSNLSGRGLLNQWFGPAIFDNMLGEYIMVVRSRQ